MVDGDPTTAHHWRTDPASTGWAVAPSAPIQCGSVATMTEFYGTLAQVNFTLLGLWLVVVQMRRESWGSNPSRRLGALAVTAHFVLPGVMSLLSLVNPDNGLLWRIGFAVLAMLGAVGMLLLGRGGGQGESAVARAGHWTAVILYVVIAVVAMFARAIATRTVVEPLQVEAVLLSVLVLLNLTVAVSMLLGDG